MILSVIVNGDRAIRLKRNVIPVCHLVAPKKKMNSLLHTITGGRVKERGGATGVMVVTSYLKCQTCKVHG
jgi:hypothetical protein